MKFKDVENVIRFYQGLSAVTNGTTNDRSHGASRRLTLFQWLETESVLNDAIIVWD